MNSKGNRILVALDGSEHALNTVRYLGHVLPPDNTELVFFCVLGKEPDYFLDSAVNPASRYGQDIAARWRTEQRNTIEKYMENARRLMTERGFPSEAVKIKIQEKEVGIARDIIREAQSGYDAVVAGRQGANPITRLVIGSIASKLLQSLTFVPLWLVGATEPSNKILVAVDASESSVRGVEHIGNMVGNANVEVTLFRVIRSLKQDEKFLEALGQDTSKAKAAEEAITRDIFEKAFQILEKAGMKHDQITAKVVTGVATRSGSIIAQASSGKYGTIVVGRKGHSKVGDFYMGRVTNKVVQLASKAALWVVN